jgi:hypothetical protein
MTDVWEEKNMYGGMEMARWMMEERLWGKKWGRGGCPRAKGWSRRDEELVVAHDGGETRCAGSLATEFDGDTGRIAMSFGAVVELK